MMPEDVLLEAMGAVAAHGDSQELREKQCRKLRESIENEADQLQTITYSSDSTFTNVPEFWNRDPNDPGC